MGAFERADQANLLGLHPALCWTARTTTNMPTASPAGINVIGKQSTSSTSDAAAEKRLKQYFSTKIGAEVNFIKETNARSAA